MSRLPRGRFGHPDSPYNQPDTFGDTALSENFFSDELVRVVVDSALAAVITIDDQGRVTGWGARAEETFGWTPAELMGRLLVDYIIPPRYRAAHNRGLEVYRATGQGPVLGKVIELAALHRDGHEFPVELRISPAVRVKDSTTFIAFVADITERKRAQQAEADALRKEAARMAELEETKTKFLNLAAHELRGPLTLMRGYVSMLAEGTVPPATAMGILAAQVDRMSVLVDQLLDTARLDEGRLRLDLNRVALARLATDCASRVTSLSGRKIDLEKEDPSVEVVGDPSRLAMVIENLLINATKYSEEDSPITCSIDTDAGLAIVSVSDRGHGLAPSDIPLLFTRFGRIVTPENSHISGTGLGLYLAREIALMHGGDITVSSVRHEGSTFRLILPLNPLGDHESPALQATQPVDQPKDDHTFDLENFTQADMVTLCSRLRRVALTRGSVDGLAQELTRELRSRLVELPGRVPACPLVRLYRTVRYADLDGELQAIVRRMLHDQRPQPSLRCLRLVGSAGELPEWDDPRLSSRHRVFPLASADMVADSPMIARLLQQLGVDTEQLAHTDLSMMLEPRRKAYNVFYVANAPGSPYVPAQADFVAPYSVRSVLGFGGLLEDKELFATILFSRVAIHRTAAELFKGVAQSIRLSLSAPVGAALNAEDVPGQTATSSQVAPTV